MRSSVFVKIDRYKELYDVVRQIKTRLDDAQQLLKKIKDIKSQEDAELRSWEGELNTMKQKLTEISNVMSER